MKNSIILFLLVIVSCDSIEQKQNDKSELSDVDTAGSENVNETRLMASELKRLVDTGNPYQYYHWNERMASLLKSQLGNGNQQDQLLTWFQYCNQLLNAGQSGLCISEIENFISNNSLSYEQFLNDQSKPIIELLALAYLRLGEQENCQMNHSKYSCILPIQTPAIHQLTNGSTKAIELYRLLYDRYSDHKFKWLLNLAYMTLGEHPSIVPAKYLIEFPNKKLELGSFNRFDDIAAEIGVSIDGLSGGVCVDDFNNDGLLDIFCTSYGMND